MHSEGQLGLAAAGSLSQQRRMLLVDQEPPELKRPPRWQAEPPRCRKVDARFYLLMRDDPTKLRTPGQTTSREATTVMRELDAAKHTL